MSKDKQLGFGGQWVEIFKEGTHVGRDDKGKPLTMAVSAEFLEAVAANYDPSLHESPAVIGHPETDAPAYGWVKALRVQDGMLQAQFADTDPGFEEIVENGRYKKRSPKFYLDQKVTGKAPYLRHVGWLGAMPPAVKGMRDVERRHAQFSEEEGQTVSFEIEFSEGEQMDQEQLDKTIGERIAAFFKEKFSAKQADAGAAVAFSEADAKALIESAVKSAVDPLTVKITSLETENASLKTQVATIGTNGTHASNVAFCEDLERKGILPPAFRRNGGVEFMDLLAGLPAENKVTTIEFAEENGKQVEKKTETPALDYFKGFLAAHPPYIQFGEAFGDLKGEGDGSDILNPERIKKMRTEAGLPEKN